MFCITFYAYIMLWKTWRIVYMYLDLYFYWIKVKNWKFNVKRRSENLHHIPPGLPLRRENRGFPSKHGENFEFLKNQE